MAQSKGPILTFQAPPSQSSNNDPWGLGAWGDHTVDAKGVFTFDNDATVANTEGPFGRFENAPTLHNLSDVMDQFGKMRGADLAALQQALYLGRFYSSSYIPTLGVIHAEDISAFREALKIASAQGVSLAQFINDSALAGQEQGSRTAHNYEQLTHEIRLSDPNALGLTMESAFEDALGRKPTDAERSRFIASFHARESAAQTVGFNAQDAARQAYINRDINNQDSGGPVSQTVTETTPNAQADAITMARQEDPQEYGGWQFVKAGNQFLQLLKGGI